MLLLFVVSDIAKQDRGWIAGALNVQLLVSQIRTTNSKFTPSPKMTCPVVLLKNRSRRKAVLHHFAQHKEQTRKNAVTETYE